MPSKMAMPCIWQVVTSLTSFTLNLPKQGLNLLRNTIRWQHNVQNVVDQLVLKYPIVGRRRRQRGRRINLHQPRLQRVVNDDIVPVTLEAVPIAGHHARDGLQRVHNQPGDRPKQLVRNFLPAGSLQVQAQVLDAPLAAVMVVVLTLESSQCNYLG